MRKTPIDFDLRKAGIAIDDRTRKEPKYDDWVKELNDSLVCIIIFLGRIRRRGRQKANQYTKFRAYNQPLSNRSVVCE